MDESGPVKGPRCGIENCRSRIYEQGEDGYLYCQNGHRRGELLRGKDEDDFTTAARTKTRRKRDDDDERDTSKYFKGQKALDLYLKCLQLILRHQVWFLVREKGLPAELETVVLDLWALRIAQLAGRVSGESQGYDSQSQAFSTSENESHSDEDKIRSVRREKKVKGSPTLVDCLGLCYLGIITLRLPITPGDIHKWITEDKMAYRRAIKYLPVAMRDRLPAYYHAVLDPNGILTFKRFYVAMVDLQIGFEERHGILWPSLNVPLLIYRYLKELALPLELYDATIKLGNLLEYDFALHAEDKGRVSIRHLPEAQLIACLVVCVKLIYPFDGVSRFPLTSSEPAATVLDWDIWQREFASVKTKARGEVLALTNEEMIGLNEKDVFSMLPHQLDQYLDFYQESFLDEPHSEAAEPKSEFRSALYDLFPVHESVDSQDHPLNGTDDAQKLKLVRAVHKNVSPSRVVKEDEGFVERLRPGEAYKYYKVAEDLPEHARAFYEEAARIAGLSFDMLVKSVFYTEKKIEKWRKTRRDLVKPSSLA